MDNAQRELTIRVPTFQEAELTAGKLLAMPFRKQRDWKLPNGDQPETRTKTETRPDGETNL